MGAILLGALGFLKGRRATTYPVAELKTILENFGAKVVWQTFVEEGNVATAAQCLAGKHLAGAEAKEKTLSSIEPLDDLKIEI